MTAGGGPPAPGRPALGEVVRGHLPRAWAGPGRRAAWRRTKARRVLAAATLALAAWLVLGAVLPPPVPRGVPVVVAARELAAGTVLGSADLRVARWPEDVRPGAGVADPALLLGRVLASAAAEGEAVSTTRLRGPGLLTGLDAASVAAHVTPADARMAGILRPGDHVDVIDNTDGSTLGRDLVVLATDAPAPPGGWAAGAAGSEAPAGALLGVSPSVAAALARAAGSDVPGSGITLVLRPSSS